MTQERFKLVPAVAVMLKKDNKVILAKRKKIGWGNGLFALPGGGVDGDETVLHAGAREVKEELGVIVNSRDLKVVHVMHIRGKAYSESVVFFLEANRWEGEVKNMEPESHELVEWHDLSSMPENIVSELKLALEKIVKQEVYSEFGWQ